jgi:hypothetical protein
MRVERTDKYRGISMIKIEGTNAIKTEGTVIIKIEGTKMIKDKVRLSQLFCESSKRIRKITGKISRHCRNNIGSL